MGMAIQTVADPADRGKLGRVHAVPQDDVEVTLEAGILSLAVKAVPFEVKGNFIRQERPWGNWRRKLELPTDVDSAKLAAKFENGVLIVRTEGGEGKAATNRDWRSAQGDRRPC